MEREEIIALIESEIKKAFDDIKLEIGIEIEKQLKEMHSGSVSDVEILRVIQPELEKLRQSLSRQVLGLTDNPSWKPDPDYNKDGKLHARKDKVIVQPTEQNTYAHKPGAKLEDEQFEVEGHQADILCKQGKTTFVKVSKVFVEKTPPGVTSRVIGGLRTE